MDSGDANVIAQAIASSPQFLGAIKQAYLARFGDSERKAAPPTQLGTEWGGFGLRVLWRDSTWLAS
jgi:hypothetical protein